MLKKRDTVRSTEELGSIFTNVELPDGDILYQSDQYLQLGCDLRDLKLLSTVLASAVDVESSSILLIAEVSITYMNVEAADRLIEFASKLPEGKILRECLTIIADLAARFSLLEQIIPEGLDHPFARTMMAHFDKLGTALNAAQKYPTTKAQV
jgi:tRNA wybutosine-synthesizing protein 4